MYTSAPAPNPVLIIDAFNLASRCFYAAWPRWEKEGGEPTDDRALLGFAWSLTNTIAKFQPMMTYFCVDAGKPIARKEVLPCYKAHRKTNPYMKPHRMLCAELVYRFLPVRIIKIKDYEADDTMARLAEFLHQEEDQIIIATRDRDLVQVRQHLRCDNVLVYDAENDKKGLNNGFLEPSRPDTLENIWKAIVGDTSDNIPSCTGEKTANKILDNDGLDGLSEWLGGSLNKIKNKDEKNNILYETIRSSGREPCLRDIFDRNLKVTTLLGDDCIIPSIRRSYVDMPTNRLDFEGLVKALNAFQPPEAPEMALPDEEAEEAPKQRSYKPNYDRFRRIWMDMASRDNCARMYTVR